MCIENKEKVGREWPIFLFFKKRNHFGVFLTDRQADRRGETGFGGIGR